jgi:uncharacterized repeat protein (TIGR02543 family)
MKKNKTWFFALIGLVTVASLFTVCKATGSGGDLFSTLFDHTIEVGYDEFRALQPTEQKLLGLDPGKLADPVPVGGGIALSDGNNILGVKIGRFDAEKYTLKVYDPDLDGDNNPDTPAAGTPQWPAGGLFVTFDADGGILEGAATAEAAPGGTVGSLPSASREDYTFGFWWTVRAGGGSRFDGETVVNAGITVYAKWISLDASQRALSFELYGGSLSGSIPGDNPQIVGAGANAARPLPDPHKTGCAFDGWFDAESGGSEIAWPLTITEDRTAHARWTEVAPPSTSVSGTITTSDADRFKTTIAVQLQSGGTSVGAAVHPLADGSYTISGVLPGTYTIEVVLDGWETAEIGEFSVADVDTPVSGKDALLEHHAAYAVGNTGPAGGKIFYVNANYETAGWRYLEVALTDVSSAAPWGGRGTDVTTGTAIGTGKQNTLNIIEVVAGLGETGTAAQLCAAWSYNGLTNWFLPSMDELHRMYTARASIGVFPSGLYAASSQYTATAGYYENLSTGKQMYGGYKDQARVVRAVRDFL